MRGVAKSIGDTVFGSLGRVMARTQEKRSLPVDLLESDDAYLVIFDAPGATADNVRVAFEDRRVTVRIERFRSAHEGFDTILPGRGLSLDGTVSLPDGAVVDPTEATATVQDNGTLHVRVPKAEPGDESEAIDVETGESTTTEGTGEADAGGNPDESEAGE